MILNFPRHSCKITFYSDIEVLTPWWSDTAPFLFSALSYVVVEIPPPPWEMVEVSAPPPGKTV